MANKITIEKLPKRSEQPRFTPEPIVEEPVIDTTSTVSDVVNRAPETNQRTIRLPYIALPYQKAVASDKHRFVTVVASRRVGKTVMALNRLLEWALVRNVPDYTPFWLLEPYFHQAKTVAWNLLLQYVPQELWSRKPNESNLTVYLINTRTITLKGADNPYGLEGTALGGLIVDEVSLMSNWSQLWDYSLRPMLADYQSPAMFISKPRGYNFFHDLAKRGDHNNIIEGEAREGVKLDKDYMTFRFPTEQNCKQHNGGYIEHEEIETARETLPPDAYLQEWEGKFTKNTGLVYKNFDRNVHVIPNMQLPLEWQRYRSMDFGSNDPMASLKIAIDPDQNWYIEDTIKQKDMGIEPFVDLIKEQDKDFLTIGGADSIPSVADPTGRMWIREINKHGLSVRKAIRSENTSEKSWLQLGIDKTSEKMKPREGHIVFLPDHEGTKIENAPSFFILNKKNNYMLVSEFETMSYRETNMSINSAQVDDRNDQYGHYDLEACMRYFAVSFGRKLSFTSLSQVQENPNMFRSQQSQNLLKPFYTPSNINLNDPVARAEAELQADLLAVKGQTVN